MKQINYTLLTFLLIAFAAGAGQLWAQNVGINSDNSNPDASAMLDIKATNKGLLIPRISLIAVANGTSPIASPATGLLVYNNNASITGGSGVGFYYWSGTQWTKLMTSQSNDWSLTGNAGTSAASNFIGTTDAVDLVFRTNNGERVRILSNGNVGIGTATPAYRLDLANGTFAFGNSNSRSETRDNAGLQGNAGAQSGFFETSAPINYPTGATSWWHLIDVRHSNLTNNYALQIAGSFFDQELWYRKTNNSATTSWSRLLTSTSGWTTLGNSGTIASTNFVGTTDAVDFVTRTNNIERMRMTSAGALGIGTTAPAAGTRLQVAGGSIMPQTGNNSSSGIYFTPNPGGGGGDEAFIRHYVEAGENTKLVIANLNDADDDISFRTGTDRERIQINGNGNTYINRGVFFDCNDCGSNTFDNADGAGSNWGDLTIQGRVISTNANMHLSPPGGSKVIINSSYRAAGGGTGTTGLDIEDGGIRMRKNYMYFQRYRYCNCYGAGSASYDLGVWDFCAVAHFGFKNNQSATDEDDDVQCAVYPNGAGYGEQTNYTYYFTEQYNTKRNWYMYLEAFEDTNGITCAASCWNLE